MKRTILITLLTAACIVGTAQAQQVFFHMDEDYCQALAAMTTGFAQDRADGQTVEALYQQIDDFDFTDQIAWDAKFVAELIHKYPHLSPSEEGNYVYELCVMGRG